MDQQTITKEMMNFNKMLFDNSFNAISAIQDQSGKMIAAFVDKAAWLPDDGKKAITDYLLAYTKGRDDFKTVADAKYEEVANYFMKKENIATHRMKK
jgi:hypothetical protein